MTSEEMELAHNGELLPMSANNTLHYSATLRGMAEMNGIGSNGVTSIDEIPSQNSTFTQISSSLSSHDTTRAIGSPTLMHLTNALVTHFTYAFNPRF